MVNLTKNQQKRELMKTDVSQSKQSTLDDLSFQFNIERSTQVTRPTKTIIINQISHKIEKDELTLKVEFALLPSNKAFSKINLDLYFNDQLINSTTLCVPQSALLNDNLEFSTVLMMKGIVAGSYPIRVQMYELWDSSEKLCFNEEEIVVEYVPQSKESLIAKSPTIKSVSGSDLTVVSSTAKNINQEKGLFPKQESIAKRDEWQIS